MSRWLPPSYQARENKFDAKCIQDTHGSRCPGALSRQVDLRLLDIIAPCRLLGHGEAVAGAGSADSSFPVRAPAVGAESAGVADGKGGSGDSELDSIAELEAEAEAFLLLASKNDGGGSKGDFSDSEEGKVPIHDGGGPEPEHEAGREYAAGGGGEGLAPSAAISVQLLSAQLTAQLSYVLEDDGGVFPLTEEQQRRVQLSVGRWRNAGLGAVFNTWRHVLGLIAVHRVSLLEVYHAACREQQLPATAATAGTALYKFLADPVGGAILAAHSGLGPPSAAALACALRATTLAGERYPSLDVVNLRVFERMAPLSAVDVSDNNIRDEGLAVLVAAVVAVGAALKAFNASFNNLTDRSGDQASFAWLCRLAASPSAAHKGLCVCTQRHSLEYYVEDNGRYILA